MISLITSVVHGNYHSLILHRVTVNITELTIVGIPSNGDVGNYTVNLRAYDGTGEESNYSVNVEVVHNYPVVYVSISIKIMLNICRTT